MRHTLRVAAVAVCVVILSWSQAAADWDEGDYAKWVQLPDLTTTGMDIYAPYDSDGTGDIWDFSIRDDWLCTSTDRITAIHFWGSWLNDVNTLGLDGVNIWIQSDNAGVPGNYLWWGQWGTHLGPWTPAIIGKSPVPMTMTERVYYTLPEGDTEIFWDGSANGGNGGQLGTDSVVYQYNFQISETNAFLQQGTVAAPNIYWLFITAHSAATDEYFGWKIRDLNDGHYRQDAVYLYPWTLKNVVYPAGHPYAGQSADMAFVVPEPATVVLMGLGTAGTLLLRRKRR